MRRAAPFPILAGIAVIVTLIVALLYALLGGGDGAPRGEMVRLEPPDPSAETPVCDEAHHVCLVHTASGLLRALYMYDTHDESRAEGCAVRWDADFSFADPETGADRAGWFRAECSGTLYRLDGQRVSGPGQRNLDQYPVLLAGNGAEVYTGRLICGASPGEEDCAFAPAEE